MRRVRLEIERFKKARAEPTQNRVAFSGRHENLLVSHVSYGINHWQCIVQPLHTDRAFDGGHAVLTGLARLFQRGNGAPEQQQRPGDIAPRGLEASLLPVARLGEQRADIFVEHGERGVGDPSFEVRGLGHQDCRAPGRLEIGDVLRGHDAALLDQPAQPGRMDAPRPLAVAPQTPREIEAVQKGEQVRGCRRFRAVAQPGEAGPAALWIEAQESLKGMPVRLGEPGPEDIERLLPGTGARRKADAFQHRDGRDHHEARTQMRQNGQHDRLAAIRRPGCVGARLQTGPPIGEPEAAQPQVALQLGDMLAAGFVPLGVFREQGGADAELVRHEGNHRRRRNFPGRQDAARKPQQAELHREAETVTRPPLAADQRQIVRSEHVMAGHRLRRVRDGEEPGALLGGEEAAAGHGGPWV